MYSPDHVVRYRGAVVRTDRSSRPFWLREVLQKLWHFIRSMFIHKKEYAIGVVSDSEHRSVVKGTADIFVKQSQKQKTLDMFFTEDDAFGEDSPDARFECDENQIPELILGSTTNLEGYFISNQTIRCIHPPSGTTVYVRFMHLREELWFRGNIEFISPQGIGLICWPATLILESDPLDIFYEMD